MTKINLLVRQKETYTRSLIEKKPYKAKFTPFYAAIFVFTKNYNR
jgi:hypothetical protein